MQPTIEVESTIKITVKSHPDDPSGLDMEAATLLAQAEARRQKAGALIDAYRTNSNAAQFVYEARHLT